MKFRLALLITVLVPAPAAANYCAAPLSRINATISGVVNTYYPVTANVSSGTDIPVGAGRGAQEDLRVGDLMLVIQPQIMQYTNPVQSTSKTFGDGSGRGWNHLNQTGKIQWVRVVGIGGGPDLPQGDLVLAAGSSGVIKVRQGGGTGPNVVLQVTGSGTVRSAQLVRVPQYGNATISGTVTALPYQQTQTVSTSGPQSVGGIVALDVAGTLTFAGNINVNALGFRGGLGHALNGSNVASTLHSMARWWAFSATAGGTSIREFGGVKGEGGAGTPPRLYSQGLPLTGLNYAAGGSGVSADGYGVGTGGAGAYGRGAPGNAGGGATDGCPIAINVSSTDTATMCTYSAAQAGNPGYVSYRGNRLNPGGGGGGGAGNGGDGSSHDLDGSYNGPYGTSPQLPFPAGYDPATEQYAGGGLGGRGVYPYTAFESDALPLIYGEHQYASLGGGGGAGSTNDAAGFINSSGGTGGGIVLIRAGKIAGSGAISANGGDAPDVLTDDGAGGGGGGGWILVSARQASNPLLTMTARGGAGGDAAGGMGAGGGGGGGYIGTSLTLPAPSLSGVTGGPGGSISGSLVASTAMLAANPVRTVVQASPAGSGSAGAVGQFEASGFSIPAESAGLADKARSSNSVAPGPQCVPIATKSFSLDGINFQSAISTPANTPFKMRLTIENPNENALYDPAQTLTQVFEQITFTDTYPANVKNATPPNVQVNGCGNMTPSATGGGSSLSVTAAGSVQGQSTCVITVDLIATAPGTHTNQIAPGGLQVKHAASLGAAALTLSNYDTLSASVTVPSGVTAQKTSSVYSDPLSGTANPKRIPGAKIDYLVSVANASAAILDNNTMVITDQLPSQSSIFLGNIATDSPISSGAPFIFTANSSNLTCTFASLSDQNDCIDFSTDGADWTYSPLPNPGTGIDPAVKYIRFKTQGQMAIGSSASVRYRTIIR